MTTTIKTHSRGVRRYDPEILVAEVSKLMGLELSTSMILEDGVRFDSVNDQTGFLEVTLMKAVDIDEWRRVLNAARVYEDDSFDCGCACHG